MKRMPAGGFKPKWGSNSPKKEKKISQLTQTRGLEEGMNESSCGALGGAKGVSREGQLQSINEC